MRRLILLIVVLLMFFSFASAGETGTITVSNDTYRKDVLTAFEVTTRSPDWGMILIDYPNFDKVSNISLFMNGQMTYNKESNYTSFTITQNGSGHGVVSYSKALDRVNYVFSDDSIFTGATVNLTFDYPILNDTRITTANKTTGSRPEVTGYQLCINVVRSTTNTLSCLTGNTFSITSEYIKTELSRVNYTTTYENNLAGQFFTISVDKSNSLINNKVKLHSQTQTYQNETTFNQNNLYYAGAYLDGLYLNLSITSGAYNDALINSSGTTITTQAYGRGGSQNGQMNFDTVQPYFKGYFGINITMNATTFDSNKRYFIDVFKPDGTEKVGFPIEISSATYYTGRNWVFDDLGLWNATLTDCSQFNFLCGATGFFGLSGPPSYQQLIACINNPLCGTRSHLVDVAVQVINVSEYTYNITSDSTVYATNDTAYFNITSTNPAGAYFTILDSLGNVVNPLANNVLVGQGVTLYNVTIPTTIQNGNYTAILALNTGYFAQVKAYQFSIGIVSGRDSISWGNNNIFGYTNTLYYSNGVNSVSGPNYITVSKLINDSLVEFDNFTILNDNTVSSHSYLMDTVGFWSAGIHNTTTTTTKYANMSVFASSVGLCNTKLDDFVCFNNQSYFPGDTYTINYQTKSLPDCALTGPCIPPYSKIAVKVINPNSVAVFNKTIVDCTNKGGIITNSPCHYSKPLLGSAISMFKVSSVPGTYQVLLVLDRRDYRNNSDQVIEDVLASNTAVLISKPIATPAPPSGQEGTNAMGANLLNFMFVPAFWGVIIWFSVVVISASSGANNAMSNTGVVALAAALLLAVVGLFDPYRWFVLAGLIVIAGIWFTVGRKVTSEG